MSESITRLAKQDSVARLRKLAVERDNLKDCLAAKFEMPQGAQLDEAFRLAWDYGSGGPDVESYFSDLVHLVNL